LPEERREEDHSGLFLLLLNEGKKYEEHGMSERTQKAITIKPLDRDVKYLIGS